MASVVGTAGPPTFDAARLARARRYRVFRLRVLLSSQLIGIALMLALHAFGVSVGLRDALARQPSFLGTYAVVSIFIVAGWLAGLPLSYLSHRRGRAEGLVVQGLASAVADRLKSLALMLALLGVPVTLWYALLARDDWWVFTIGGAVALALLMSAIGPFLQALFFRFTRLEDPMVVDRIKALGERVGVRVADVYRWAVSEKATVGNAAVVGLGPTKRIVVADTLLERYPPDEVEAVIAHELAHQVHRDVARYVGVAGVGLSASLIGLKLVIDALTAGTSVRGAADVASFPLLAIGFAILRFLVQPFFLAYSRHREGAADRFAARLTSPATMASALVRLADQNLSDPEPPAWEEGLFMSHPAVRNRVRALGRPWPPAPRPATG